MSENKTNNTVICDPADTAPESTPSWPDKICTADGGNIQGFR